MEGSVVEDLGAPESWEVADLDATMSRLMLSSNKEPKPEFPDATSSSSSVSSAEKVVAEDVINQVDQFLREAIQNPRERLSILRMEQDVEKFIRDPTQQQLEFQQLPTSYLRIIVCKTSECRLPPVRLADIPVNLPSEDPGVVKVAIKQRPQKRSQLASNSNSNSLKSNNSKSVEERKEEYNRARARIFNSNSSSSGSGGKPESELRLQDASYYGSSGMPKMEEKPVSVVSDVNSGRGLIESSTSSNRSARSRTEKEPSGRSKPNNRVAIFRDRETDRKDPDYDRNYDRYMQRSDPGFGFNSGPYTMQPMYTPAINYNTEFPQLGSTHRPQISTEHQPLPLPQHIPGPWVAPSTATGISYGHPETMMPPFNPNHVGARSTSTIYLHSSQYPCQHPGMPFIHPHEHVHQPFSQAYTCFLNILSAELSGRNRKTSSFFCS
ncbi:R3H domain-containing protein 1-like isoform X4 [Durio zibethinus]|uniref:R3H domain-containing protein 1-like isoform X4 n=1 Tax=Durio zibethinus TaxID=66656 RepID=A0A6P5Z4A9_DURZI|nr:R3H domain-containing protein 1-like isoform X4 [Durio zibethinus]